MQPDRLAHLKRDFGRGFIAYCGRPLMVSELEVFAVRGTQEKRVAKATFTMIPVAASRLHRP